MRRKRRPPQAAQRYWIGYCRKSSETEDRQVHSLEDQAAMVRAYYDRLPAEERSGRPLKLLEEAQSAYRPGRPVFRQMLQMAARGAVWGVIVVHPNRISRNHSDSGAFVQQLVDTQIECLDTTSGKRYTGEDSSDIFMLTLEGAISWKDSRDKGDRILSTMRRRATEGRYMTLPPVGYRIVYREDGSKSLQIDTGKASVVRALFELAAGGVTSLEDLTAEAERLGLTNRKGQRMHKSWMHKLLTNPFFKGYVRFDGIVAKGLHESLVPEETWERVQRVLSGRKKVAARPQVLRPHDPFVFRKVLRCPNCPRRLCVYEAKGRYVYYECKNPRTSCGACISQSTLLPQLKDVLERLALGPDSLDQLRRRLLETHRSENGKLSEMRQKLSEEHDRLQKEMAGLLGGRQEAVRLGIEDTVEQQLLELKERRDGVRGRLAVLSDTGTAWIDQAIRALELVPLLTEAILFGPALPRLRALQALSSNWSVKGETLVLELRTPFCQVHEAGGRLRWWASGDKARTQVGTSGDRTRTLTTTVDDARTRATMVYEMKTEVPETLRLLEAAYAEWQWEKERQRQEEGCEGSKNAVTAVTHPRFPQQQEKKAMTARGDGKQSSVVTRRHQDIPNYRVAEESTAKGADVAKEAVGLASSIQKPRMKRSTCQVSSPDWLPTS